MRHVEDLDVVMSKVREATVRESQRGQELSVAFQKLAVMDAPVKMRRGEAPAELIMRIPTLPRIPE